MSSHLIIRPRFSETDAMGHINNTSVPVWFEEARLHLCLREAKIEQKTVLARLEIDYLHEIFFGEDIEVITYISRLGNSSIHYQQKINQGEKTCLSALAVTVTYDLDTRQSVPISEDTRRKLSPFLGQPL